jgi:hypothetical protein
MAQMSTDLRLLVATLDLNTVFVHQSICVHLRHLWTKMVNSVAWHSTRRAPFPKPAAIASLN